MAMHNPAPAYAEDRRRDPTLHLGPHNPLRRLIATKQFLHTVDARTEQAYVERDPALAVALDLLSGRVHV